MLGCARPTGSSTSKVPPSDPLVQSLFVCVRSLHERLLLCYEGVALS